MLGPRCLLGRVGPRSNLGGMVVGMPGIPPLKGTPLWRKSPRRYTHSVLTPGGGLQSGRYASYWNAVLFAFRRTMLLDLIP